jgi:hypothetical protein
MREIPIRQNITVLPDDDGSLKLPFIYVEGEVVMKDKNLFVSVKDSPESFEKIIVNEIETKMNKNRLKKFDDIQDGDTVYSTWYDGQAVAMKVGNIDKDEQTALGKVSDSVWGNLYFNNDFRNCWTCGGYMFINDKALARILQAHDVFA